MSSQGKISDRFWPLLDAACDDTLVETQVQELVAVLTSDPRTRKIFVEHIHLRRRIRSLHRAERLCDLGLARIQTLAQPPVSSSRSTAPIFLSTTLHGTISYLSSGWPVAYLIATVVVGVGLWISSVTPAFYPQQIAKQSSSTPEIGPTPEPQKELVGRVTATADCQWARNEVPLLVNDAVPVGRTIRLESGLMEIAYGAGTKVILQGPVAYEVESPAGGVLSVGRLTARVENSKTKDQRPRTEDPHPLFVVRTPTAVVTDLGTEFGVEVDRKGATTSHVFRGSVRVQMVGDGGEPAGAGRVLHENESAQVESGDANRGIVLVPNPTSASFIRSMPEWKSRVLDLVDVVAGGDGFAGRRNRGIDVTTGRPSDGRVLLNSVPSVLDGTYHRVSGLPFLDGVFAPSSGVSQVQIDSAGHTFDGFPASGGLIYRDDYETATVGESVHRRQPIWGAETSSDADSVIADATATPSGMAANGSKYVKLGPGKSLMLNIAPADQAATAGHLIEFSLRVYVGKGDGAKNLCICAMSSPASHDRDQWQINLWDDGRIMDGTTGKYTAVGRFRLDKWIPVRVIADYTAKRCLAVVDGIVCDVQPFIPNAGESLGHLYLAATRGSVAAFDDVAIQYVPFPVWAGGAAPVAAAGLSAELDGVDYAAPGHGALWLHANRGITFDLEAIRRANPGCRLAMFRATAGCATATTDQASSALADIWVFVDGQPRFQRRRISRGNGVFSLALPIGCNDRFLTLAATDGGDGPAWDWIVFGDPQLEVVSFK
jgi:hypothetical protein